MNTAQIYKKALNPINIDEREDALKKQQERLLLAAAKDEWLSHPLTKSLINLLREQKEEAYKAASNIANSDGEERAINRKLIRAKTLEEIETYATGK